MIRYYMGRHKIKILISAGKKKLVEHLGSGHVGNKKIGYKQVKKGDKDIVLSRHCYKISHFEKMENLAKIPFNKCDHTCNVCLFILTLFGAFCSFTHLLIKKLEVIK